MKAQTRSALSKLSGPLSWRYGSDLTDAARRGESQLLARQLRGRETLSPQLVGEAASAGDPVALAAMRESAIAVGGTVANVVNFANPGVLVLGGGVLRNRDEFFPEFRRTVLERAIQLATQRQEELVECGKAFVLEFGGGGPQHPDAGDRGYLCRSV